MMILATCAALACAWLLHAALWRLRRPRRPYRAMLWIFGGTWAVACLAGWRLGMALGPLEAFYASALYALAALAYAITYSAVEGDSPTLSLVRHLHRHGQDGIGPEEMEAFFRQRPFAAARIRALVDDGILAEEAGGYRLRHGRHLLFRVVLGYRRVVFGPVDPGG